MRTSSSEAAEASLQMLEENGFVVESRTEARGAQIPGMGPEGLDASRRVLMAKVSIK